MTITSMSGAQTELPYDASAEDISEAANKPNPFVLKANERKQREEKLVNLAKARDAKVQKKTLNEEQALESMREEYKTIDARVARADQEYGEAYKAATKDQGYDKKLWDRADAKQRAILNLLARQRVLQKKFENSGRDSFEAKLDTPGTLLNTGDSVQTTMTLTGD